MQRLLHAAHAWNLANGFNFTAADIALDDLAPRLDPATFFVAEHGGRLVGTVEVAPGSLLGRWGFHLLAVAPEAAGLGVGRALVGHAEAIARSRGAGEMLLDTPETHPWLPAFYSRLGYTVIDTVQWEGKRYRSVVMRKGFTA